MSSDKTAVGAAADQNTFDDEGTFDDDVFDDVTDEDRDGTDESRSGAVRRKAAERAAALSKPAADVSAAASTAASVTASLPALIVEAVRNLLARPLASYQLVLTMAFLLTTFGLVMVLSASSVEGYSEDGSAYGLFTTQVIFAGLGLVVFYLMLRVPIRLLRRFAAPSMAITILLLGLVLIPGIGVLSQGARRWFIIAGVSVQPSELVKVALCLWGAHLLASRRRDNASIKELLIPLVPVAMLVCVLIILEPNLSTTITIAIIVGAMLWFAGLPIKVFSAFAVSGVVLAVILALAEGYRSQRVMSFLGGIDDPQGAGYQARQATYALANGGVFGVGLGQSSAKWNYLPNAHNDFIFAIIGEELGLLGGLLVVFLFVLLGYIGFRIAHRSTDPFLRLMTATITVLILAQAFINIGYVIGLLPVTGIQLPLISAGGTSTLTVLAMLGLLANAARHEPEAVAALTTGTPGRLARVLRLQPPVAYRQSRAETLRDRLDQRRSSGGRGTGRSAAPGRAAATGRTGASNRRGRPAEPAPSRGRFTMPWKRTKAPEPAPARGASARRTAAGGRTRPAPSTRVGVDYRGGYPGAGTARRSASPGWRAGAHQPRTPRSADPGRDRPTYGRAGRR
ncbi:putative lipid II flippase FtsW [Gordonia westfalica]|uniref:Probable peptidoglycan glycosyltransferase FtsW n=1 Tax=Gordonia westfalica TaxID=158898 RepID=A0ABU2GM89_9ACTN|nr:putative lipid II flippase FtsW [Gordonia westfalica]MDS1112577.1 putative lipid II flippase FtsW [Gordonia westfalica]